MHRREFLGVLGSAAAAWPLVARAQPATKIPRIGVLWPNPPATFEFLRQGLKERGYIEGQNIRFEFRWAEGSGLVASLARPGGNLTGTTRMLPEMSAKHVELLKQAVPSLSKLAVLWNPMNTSHRSALQAVEVAARSLSLQVYPLEVERPAELDVAFATISRDKVDGLLFIADPVFFINLKRMADFVAASRLPAVANFIEFPKLGGLMGYAPSIPEEFRHVAGHIDKILKGAKPADFTVELPKKFLLVINLKTAKTLGLTVPDKLIGTADEVIE